MTSFGQIAVDCVPRYVSHSIGASMFFLGFGMAHTGVIAFIMILIFEGYFTGSSLLYIQEMTKAHTEPEREETNYFLEIEKHFPKRFRLFIRILFVVDVVNCTAFYYKVSQALVESLIFADQCSIQERTGSTLITCCAVTLLLIAMEYGQKYIQNPPRLTQQVSQQCNFRQVQADVLHVDFGSPNNAEQDDDDDRINMSVDLLPSWLGILCNIKKRALIASRPVKKEMNNFSRKRPVLLLLFMLLFFATITVSHDTKETIKSDVFNASAQCPGLFTPISWIRLDVNIFSTMAIVIYALKNYTIMLPVCVGELSYSKKDYAGLVFWSAFTLVVVYSLQALSVYLTFGESVPALFATAYGKNFVGLPIVSLALGMTVNAMLLRIMACFKLIQVLFCKDDTENVFWLVVIFSVFASLLLALAVNNVLYLVVFAGCVTCNWLVILLPSISYIKLKWDEKKRFNVHVYLAIIGLVVHIGLFVSTPIALYTLDMNNGEGCRTIMNYYWNDEVSGSTCRPY